MSIDALHTLCQVRLAAERQAEQQLGPAAALLARARDHQVRLAAELDAVRAGRDRTRAGALTPSSAGALQVERRYAARLDAELRAAVAAVEAHVAGPLAAAAAALDRARANHLRARQRREVVERAITRRQAARRLEDARRAEAANDDLAQRRK
jgi:flagellar biosynthesis chaperone FliJ